MIIQTQGLGHRRILYNAAVVKHVGEFLKEYKGQR